jgi:hypothetical protein
MLIVVLSPFFSQLIVVKNKAGNDPTQGSTAWLDRFFAMGEFTKDLEMLHVDVYGGMYLFSLLLKIRLLTPTDNRYFRVLSCLNTT